jgi:hypothetical protein
VNVSSPELLNSSDNIWKQKAYNENWCTDLILYKITELKMSMSVF